MGDAGIGQFDPSPFNERTLQCLSARTTPIVRNPPLSRDQTITRDEALNSS